MATDRTWRNPPKGVPYLDKHNPLREGSAPPKDVAFAFHLERDLRDAFTERCHEEGRSAAYVLRSLMREHLGREKPAHGRARG
jgi:hypothetical protein